MKCIHCNEELPDNAIFCANCGGKTDEPTVPMCTGCGLQLPEGAKFCPVCCTPVGGSAPAQPSVEAVTAPEMGNKPDMPAAEPPISASVSKPVGERPVVLSKGSAEPAPVPMPTSTPVPANDAQPVPAPTPVPANDAQPTPVTEPIPTPAPQYGGFNQPDYGFGAAAAAAVVPVTKKKSKVGLIIACAAVLVVVVLAVIALLNKGPVMNLFMGNSAYAAMLEGRGIKTVSEHAGNPVIVDAIEAGSRSFAAAAKINTYETDVEEASSGVNFGQIISEINSSMLTAYGTDALTVGYDVDISLTDTTKALIFGDSPNEQFDEILKAVNESSVLFTVRSGEKAVYAGMEFNGGGVFINSDSLICSDGSVYVRMPFGSDTAIKYVVEQGEVVSTETVTALKLDSNEISRLTQEIVDIYLEYYENSSITVEKGSLTAAGVTANGKLITAEFDGKALASMFASICDKIANDKYFCEKITAFAEECDMDFTAEDYKKAVEDFFDYDLDENDKLIICTITDKNNTILAKSYEVIDAESCGKLVVINGKEKFALEASEDNSVVCTVDVTKTDEHSGSAIVKVAGEDKGVWGFKAEYSGVEKKTFLNRECMTGSVTFSVTMPSDFTAEMDKEEADMLKALNSAKLTISGNVDESGRYDSNIVFDVPKYGSLAINTNCFEPTDKPSLEAPEKAVDITELLVNSGGGALSDSAKASAEQLKGMVTDVKAAVAQGDGIFASALDMVLDTMIEAIDSAIEPQADFDDMSELNNRIYELLNDMKEAESYYSAVLADNLSEQFNDIYSEVEQIYESDFNWGMSAAELGQMETRVDALEKRYEELCSELSAKMEEYLANLTTIDYSSLNYDELLVAVLDLEQRLFDIENNYADAILSSDELMNIYNDCVDCYNEMLDDFSAMYESMSRGDMSVPLLRELRKSAEKLNKSVVALERAVSSNAA